MKKNYLIVGDNNFWYSTFEASTQKEIDDEVIFVKKTIKEDFVNSLGTPTELFVYEVTHHQTFKNE